MIVEIKKKKKRKEKEKISNKCYRKIRILIRNNELKILWRKLFSSLFFIVSNHIFIQEKYWIAHLLYYLCLIKDSRHNINVTCEKQLLFLTTTCIPISNPFLNIKLRCWINLSNLYLFNKWKIAIAIYSLSYIFFYLIIILQLLFRLEFSSTSCIRSLHICLHSIVNISIIVII